jgi:hypothetical protein
VDGVGMMAYPEKIGWVDQRGAPVARTACVGENAHAAVCQVIGVGYEKCSAKPNISRTPRRRGARGCTLRVLPTG